MTENITMDLGIEMGGNNWGNRKVVLGGFYL